MRFTKLLLLASLMLFFFSGLQSCKKSKKNDNVEDTASISEDDMETEDNSTNSSSNSSEDYINKYNAYIDYFNTFNDRLNEAYQAYYREGLDFVPSEKSLPMIYTIPDYSLTNLEEFVVKKPAFKDVDKAAKSMLETGKQISKIMVDLDGYYQRKDYRDDKFAKAIADDKKLDDLFDTYFEQYDVVKADFEKITDQVVADDLKRYKKEGKMITYNMLDAVTKAKKLSNYVNSSKDGVGADLDTNKLKSLLADFRAPYDKVVSYQGDKGQIDKELEGAGSAYYSQFLNYGDEFISAVRDLEDRIENNDFDFSITHPDIPDDGSIEQVNESFSSMVDSYNNAIRF